MPTAKPASPYTPLHRPIIVPRSPSRRNVSSASSAFIYQPLDDIINLPPRNAMKPSPPLPPTSRVPLSVKPVHENANTNRNIGGNALFGGLREKNVNNNYKNNINTNNKEKKHTFTFHHPPPMTRRLLPRCAGASDDKENVTATVTFTGGSESKRVKRKEPTLGTGVTPRKPRFTIHRDRDTLQRPDERGNENKEGTAKRRKAVKFQASPMAMEEEGKRRERIKEMERRMEMLTGRGMDTIMEVKGVERAEESKQPQVDDIIIDDISDPMEVDEPAIPRRPQMGAHKEEVRSSIQRQLQQQREKKRKLDTGIKSAFPQSLLTKLLLSHANPQPELPELPSPPRSRLGSSPAGSRVVTPLPQRKERLKSGYTPGPTTPSPLHQTHTAPSQPPKSVPLPATIPTPLPDPSSASPRTFTLQHLPSISHHTSTLILTLHPPTHVTLTIRHSSPPTIYTIYPGTQGVTVHNQHYSLPELPWKHLSAFRYARRFVEFVASRTLVATTRVAGDIIGKLWADGRAEVEFRGGIMIRVSASGEASVRKGDMHVYQHHLQKAVEVWEWLLHHPDEPEYQPEPQSSKQSGSLRKEVFDVGLSEDEQGWEIDHDTKFVRNVGWCKPDEKNRKWWMRFLDGVRMLVLGDGRCRWWDAEEVVGPGRWMGLNDEEVRRRVAAFVEAGI